MTIADTPRWSLKRQVQFNLAALIDDYRFLFAGAPSPGHKRIYLKWQTKHQVELDRTYRR